MFWSVQVVAALALAGTLPAGNHAGLRTALDRLTSEAGTPGALAVVRDRSGDTEIRSGVGDLRKGTPVPRGSRFRIGSVTKTFVATVVLQLVGEGRIELDAPVDRYLPGLIRGNGNDGRAITIRQLLQHRSGLPDSLEHLTIEKVIQQPLRHWEPEELIGIALAHPRTSQPGTAFAYSATNYQVAGLVIEKVTGRPYGEEIQRRIIGPLRLRDTSVPGDRTTIPGPHPRGYLRTAPAEAPKDYTRFNSSVAWAGGEMTSSAKDVNRFFATLLNGRLLRPAERRAMLDVQPTGRPGMPAYGLGIVRAPLPCGGDFWGHNGDTLGYSTRVGTTTDGRQVTVMANLSPGGTTAQRDGLINAVTTALCEGRAVRAPARPAG